MNDSVDYLRRDKTRLSVVFSMFILCFCYAVYLASDTYAASTYTVVFNRAEGTEVMKTCDTDENGKLDSDCLITISNVCSKWSLDKYKYSGYEQAGQIAVSAFADMAFSENTDYYCVAGSSHDYDMGCYVCNTDNNIMHWAADGTGNNNCSSGYTKSSTITDEANCKTVTSDACYECKNDKNIMKWDNNDKGDSSCPSGYKQSSTVTNEANCKPIIPNACYVCNDNDKIMKWDNNGNIDNKCSSGYYKINSNQSDCKPVENPPTGENILMAIVWFVGLGCLGYSIYYFKKIYIKN